MLCSICGMEVEDEEHFEEHRDVFESWLERRYEDEFIAWASERYWDEWVDEQMNSSKWEEWLEEVCWE